jgi:hypothetical protein
MRGASYIPDRLARVLRRALRLALIFPVLSGFFLASPSAAVDAPRVVVLTVDGTDIRDWVGSGAFSSLGATGLLAARTAAPSKDPTVLRASAYGSLGAGSSAEVDPRPRGESEGDATLGLVGEALARRGLLATAVGDASGGDLKDAPSPLAVTRLDGTMATGPAERVAVRDADVSVSRPDATAPAGRRTDPAAVRAAIRDRLTWASLVVVDFGDTARADRTYAADAVARGPWMRRALDDAISLANDIDAMLGPEDTLIVASLVPPLERARRGIHLSAISIAGRSALPYSGTTRRAGVVSLTDLGPTILARFGIEAPAEMSGRTIRLIPSASPTSVAAKYDAEFARALESRRPLTRAWLGVSAALCLAALLTVAAGRGRAAGATAIPHGWRDALGVGFLAVAAAPAAFLLAPLLPGDSVPAIGWWTLGISVGSGLIARTTLGHERALGAIAFADALLYVGDLVAGSPLAGRSALGFQIAGGGRFYGVDEGMLGVLLAAPLVAAAVALDRVRSHRRALVVCAIGLTAIAFLAGAPSFGSKFGAPFTLVPAFGVFVVLAAGHRLHRSNVIGIAIATVLLSGSLAAADALSSPGAASHIGREISGHTAVGPLVGRKLTSLVKVTATTAWFPSTLVMAGSALVLLVRRRDLAGRAMWGKPATRAALWATVVGSFFALVSNDTGIITVAAAAPIVAAAFYAPLLAPNQGE